MAAGQDERVPQVGQAYHALAAVVAVLLVRGLRDMRAQVAGSRGQGLGASPPGAAGDPGKPPGAEEGHQGAGRPPSTPQIKRTRGSCSPQLRGAVPPPPGSVGRQAPLTGVAPQAEPLL